MLTKVKVFTIPTVSPLTFLQGQITMIYGFELTKMT